MKLQSLILLGSALVPGVLGWGAAGHEIVATIAQIHLHPEVLPKICEILDFSSNDPTKPECHLAPISTWADKFKYRMRWSAPLHYVGALDDYPSETCAFPGDRGWAGKRFINVLGGIRNTTDLLEGYVTGEQDITTANEALKFLVHFLGDLHMPLHLTGRDRGGNSVKVKFDNRVTNLHSLWDGLLIAKNLRTIPYNYTRPLPIRQVEYNLRGAIYDPFIRRVMWEGVYSSWRDEIPDWLSCPAPPVQHTSTPSALGASWSYLHSIWTFVKSSLSISTTENRQTTTLSAPSTGPSLFISLTALDEPPYGGHGRFSEFFTEQDDHDAHHFSSVEAELAQFDKDGQFVGGRHGGSTGGRPEYLELDTPEYAGVIADQRILERLMAQAGIRLAGVLNWLFAPNGEMNVALWMPQD
ncbi:hypothetical protein VNI00_009273 [Paramarasmius palmivorus]|uniref:Phospholipase C/P1 nuclease n=1 Tax=Paramarasmius palmivorus TaxID=297713 RepID=A0AAW0CNK7_9AGAR